MTDRYLSKGKVLAALAAAASVLLCVIFFVSLNSSSASKVNPPPSSEARSDSGSVAVGEGLTSSKEAVSGAVSAAPATTLVNSALNDFRNANRCVGAIRRIALAQYQVASCNESGDGVDDAYKAFCEKLKTRAQNTLLVNQEKLVSCTSLDPREAEQMNFEHTARAAELGNVEAQLCYVSADFELQRPWTGQEHTDYAERASRYIDAAFSRGDWRIVEILRAADQSNIQDKGLLFQVTSGDQLTIYKMNRLLRRGADGEYAVYLDTILEVPAFPYKEEDIAEADRWVASVFDKNFSSSPRLKSIPFACLQEKPG